MSDDYQPVPEPGQKKVLPPLSKDQIEYAHELLEELHPLEKTPVQEAFPWVGKATCYRKKEDSAAVGDYVADSEVPAADGKAKTVTINGKEIVKRAPKKKKSIGTKAEQADPIAKLGFGIVAYVDMLWTLIYTFLLFTLLLLPTMMAFSDGKAYDNVLVKSTYLDTYLGNLGYSSVQCAQIPANVGRLSMSCPFGDIGEILDYGMNKQLNNKYVCENSAANSACQPDAAFVLTQLNSGIGLDQSFFDFSGKSLYTDHHKEDECTLTKDPVTHHWQNDATLFVQYTCIQDAASQHQKYGQLAFAVTSACLIAFLFTVSIRKMFQGGKIQQLEWDVATVTAGDYSVEFPIKKESYDWWKSEVYRAPGGDFENGVAPAFSLKKYLKKEIEEKLTLWIQDNEWAKTELYGKKKQSEGNESRYQGTKIADIVFSFNNAALIETLRARGQCIASQDFDAMRDQETKVNGLFQNFDSLTIPTSAFITFESDDSASLADMVTDTEIHVMNQKMHFVNCSEPTDIIWENRHFTNWDYIKRQGFAYFVIGILLVGSAIFIYWISAFSADLATVFPPTNCGGVEKAYADKLQESAVEDYDFVTANAGQPSSGCLQCFCAQQYKDDPDNYTTLTYGQADGDKICEFYADQVMSVYLWTTALSYLLIGINYILRTVCIMLVDWIGFSTETVRLSKTTTVTWIVQFFNSAFLLLMVNADMSEQPISFGLTTGSMPDFNTAWFRSVGDIIVLAMVFNVYYPILEVLGYWALRILFRCIDRGCKLKGDTSSTSIQGYINIYQGPLYFMHYKYSSILTIVYITFMYGFGMPVLFPIAMLSFVVMYFVEKFMLFYGHVMPPMYDERLSNDVLSKLQFAPILYLMFGYWMASNQQLISNDYLTAVPSSTSTYITSHTMQTVFQGVGWEGIKWPMLTSFFFILIIYFFGNWLMDLLCEYFPNLKIGDVEINEEIENYWKTLDEEDRKWSLREEENARNALKTKILTDDQFEALKSSTQTTGKTLQGTHSYDILANPLYLDDFQYVTAAEDDRADMIIDDDDDEGNDAAQSDLVRICLNLAYMTEQTAREFKFNKNDMKNALSAIKSNQIN